MLTALAMARAFLSKVPWQLWLVIGAALALWFAYSRGHSASDADNLAETAKIDRKALETARAADSAAITSVDATRTEVEQANDNARNAANNGSDPLADGLRSLRAN